MAEESVLVYNIESISGIQSSIISLGEEQYDTITIKGNNEKNDSFHSLSFYTSGFEKFLLEWNHNKPITEYIPYLDTFNFYGDDDELMLEIDYNLYLNSLEFKLYPAEDENNYCLELWGSYYFDVDEESLSLMNGVDSIDLGLYFLNKNDSDELLVNNDGEFSVIEGGNTSFSIDEE
jgi:hypothetical protein